MKDFITSSALTRLLANVFIFLCLVVALFVAAYEIVEGQPVNPLAFSIISAGITYSATMLGAHLPLQP